MAEWAVIADLELHLGVDADDDGRMEANLEEALAYAHRAAPWRDPDEDQGANVRKGVCMYAGILWYGRSSPQGFPGYEADGGTVDYSTAIFQIRELLGVRKPVAR